MPQNKTKSLQNPYIDEDSEWQLETKYLFLYTEKCLLNGSSELKSKKGKKGEQKKWEKKPFSANKIKPEKIVIFVYLKKFKTMYCSPSTLNTMS